MMTPGNKTTEWKATLGSIFGSLMPVVAVLVDSVTQSGLIRNGTALAMMGMLGSVLAAMGYSAGRTYLKGVDMKAKALAGKP